MRYTLENENLIVTVDSHGAELVSVKDKTTNAEMLWCGDAAVWGRTAPILFPYTGRLKNGSYQHEGKAYSGGQHGFARDMEHEFLGKEGTRMWFVLRANDETKALYPFRFELVSIFQLDGCTLRHSLAVRNAGNEPMRFGIGYHPAFALPFDETHTTEDYELKFDSPQTPTVVQTSLDPATAGLVTGETHVMMEHCDTIPITDRMFDTDSICMGDLTANTLAIVEKDTGRNITLRIQSYANTLIWSMPGDPTLRFVCIEPWRSLPDTVDATGEWNDKPCAFELAPGDNWSTNLDMDFNR